MRAKLKKKAEKKKKKKKKKKAPRLQAEKTLFLFFRPTAPFARQWGRRTVLTR